MSDYEKNIVNFLVCIFFFPSSVFAGNQVGNVTVIQAGETGSALEYVLATVSGSYNSIPSCASNSNHRWAIAPGSVLGKTMLTLLLTARTTGQTVEIYGTGGCSIIAGFEDIFYMRLRD